MDESIQPSDMDLPGYKLHNLKGKLDDTWAVYVSDNWRITFKFKGENAIFLDYLDYH